MKVLKRFFNFGRKALLEDQIRAGADDLTNQTKSLFSIARTHRQMKFEELSLHGVTSAQLRVCKNQFFKLALFYLGIAIFLFIYMGFMLAKRHFGATIMVSSLIAVCCAQAFKYHFWYYQIRQQKLGCSIAEWLKFVLRSKDDVVEQKLVSGNKSD